MNKSLIQKPKLKEDGGKINNSFNIIHCCRTHTYCLEIDVSPAKYNPNMDAVKRHIPSVALGPHTTKNIGSMKNYMESFIRTILPSTDGSTHSGLNDTPSELKPSMATQISKNSHINSKNECHLTL